MKKTLAFVATASVLIAASAGVMVLVYTGAADRRAIAISAILAWVVQVITFAIARRMGPKDVIVGWGIGVGLRFVSLAVYALVVVARVGLPSASASLSFAVFLFVSTLIEPLFLNS